MTKLTPVLLNTAKNDKELGTMHAVAKNDKGFYMRVRLRLGEVKARVRVIMSFVVLCGV